MTPKQAERWARVREKGRTRFVWIRGVFGWGIPVAVFWSIWMGWIQGWDRLWILTPLALVLFPIGGYFWGVVMWRKFESAYQEATQN
jgi:hypothetical protein